MSDDLLDVPGVARVSGLSVGTVRTYMQRSNRAREQGCRVRAGSDEALPAPDYRLGGSPVWRRETLLPWLEARG